MVIHDISGSSPVNCNEICGFWLIQHSRFFFPPFLFWAIMQLNSKLIITAPVLSINPLTGNTNSNFNLFPLQEGLVKVGWMDCNTQAQLCTELEITSSSTYYFPPGSTIKQKDKILVCICMQNPFPYSWVIIVWDLSTIGINGDDLQWPQCHCSI